MERLINNYILVLGMVYRCSKDTDEANISRGKRACFVLTSELQRGESKLLRNLLRDFTVIAKRVDIYFSENLEFDDLVDYALRIKRCVSGQEIMEKSLNKLERGNNLTPNEIVRTAAVAYYTCGTIKGMEMSLEAILAKQPD